MYLSREDVKLILEIMDEFPDARSFKLKNDDSSGIGSILSLTVETKVNDRDAEVTFEISGVENW